MRGGDENVRWEAREKEEEKRERGGGREEVKGSRSDGVGENVKIQGAANSLISSATFCSLS